MQSAYHQHAILFTKSGSSPPGPLVRFVHARNQGLKGFVGAHPRPSQSSEESVARMGVRRYMLRMTRLSREKEAIFAVLKEQTRRKFQIDKYDGCKVRERVAYEENKDKEEEEEEGERDQAAEGTVKRLS